MNYFPYVGRLLSNFRGFYNEINSATLTGAIDVLVIEQEDGSFSSSPFHVRFGKLGVLRSREKVVDIEVNGESVGLHMKLGEAGEAFFVHEVAQEDDVPVHLATSPLPSVDSLDLMEKGLQEMRERCAAIEEVASTLSGVEDIPTSIKSESETMQANVMIPSLGKVYVSVRHVGCQTVADAAAEVLESPTESMYYSLDDLPGEEVHELRCEVTTMPRVTVSVQTDDKGGIKASNWRKRRKERRKINEAANRDHSSSSSSENELMGVFEMEEDEQFLPGDGEVDKAQLTQPFLPGDGEVDKAQLTAEWANSQFVTDLHPWSDADITPNTSPVVSRPPSPKSDTEVETMKMEEKIATAEEAYDWKWGEFPTPVQDKSKKSVDDQGANTSLFQFMRRTKKIRHQPEQEGLYLDDLSESLVDPEVAQLYLYGRDRKDKTPEDIPSTSGLRGMAPTAALSIVAGANEEVESGRGPSLPHSPISMRSQSPSASDTLCRPVAHKPVFGQVTMSICGGSVDDVDSEKFLAQQVSYDAFNKDPSLISNPKLIICIDGKYYTWASAAPQLLCLAAYNKPVSAETLQILEPKKSLEGKKETKRRGWGIWNWRGPAETPITESSSHDIKESSAQNSPSKEADLSKSSQDYDDVLPDWFNNRKFTKSLRLTSDEVKKLKLRPGVNYMTFSVTSRYQGTARTEARIYLWRWDDKIIISDVDGTITRSDVLGQVLPLVGKDWSQHGIASLYNTIARNGYRFLYLSARAIGQSYQTRQLLNNVIQEKNSTLPDGPLLLTPNSLVQAFYREVIEKKPQEFKIGCLNNVKALFPESKNPLYAGFGNKMTDVWAYQAVGIPMARIFTVNHVGELRVECVSKFMTSYNKLYDIADYFFPPRECVHGIGEFNHEFSQFAYWKEQLPDVDEEISRIEAAATTSKPVDKKAKKT